MAINDIGSNFPKPVKYKLIADDCNIYCSGTNIETSKRLLQVSLNSLSQWSSKTGFKFSPSKTQSIIFNNKKRNPMPHITFNSTLLHFSKKYTHPWTNIRPKTFVELSYKETKINLHVQNEHH